MFGRMRVNTETSVSSIEDLRTALSEADAVIIGAGSGLSTAAGYTYSGERFRKYFSDFQEKYGIRDMYSGGFYPFPDMETFWAWWSRHIWVNRYAPIPSDLYEQLFRVVKDKDYFVVTTNVDHCFQRAGFDKKRLFYTQGDYGLLQSSNPQGESAYKTYDNEEICRKMLLAQGFEIGEDNELIIPEGVDIEMRVPTKLVPHCPDDGELMAMNLRSDDTFVEDGGWHEAAGRYGDFLAKHGIKAQGFFTQDSHEKVNRAYDGKVLFLELGVGGNTPGIIKYPFWQMTYAKKDAIYACLNMCQAIAPEEIRKRSICIDGDMKEILAEL